LIEANVLGVRLKAKAPTLEQFARLASVGGGWPVDGDPAASVSPGVGTETDEALRQTWR
jgi:hypothetical protein